MNDKEGQAPEIKELFKNINFRMSGLQWQTSYMTELIEDKRKVLDDPNANETEKRLAKVILEAADERAKLFTSIMNIPEPKWLVEGLVVREGITLIFGAQHVGKTSLMLQLIACAHVGKKYISLNLDKFNPLLIEQDENPSLLR
ncbi:AAA family ATPase, partial [Chloroflexota bacterium]